MKETEQKFMFNSFKVVCRSLAHNQIKDLRKTHF